MPGKKVVIVGEVYDPTLSVGWPLPPPEEKPPGIWGPLPGFPTPPIFIPPDAIAPGVPAHPIVLPPPESPNVPAHPIVLPPVPPVEPGFPSHPIVIPPGSIDGVHPEHPIVIPPPVPPDSNRPSHPIFIPPDAIAPGVPEHPIYIPPGNPGEPAHPIVLPPERPEQPPTPPTVLDKWDVKAYWTPVTGWGVGIFPTGQHPGYPTPSKGGAPPAPQRR